MSANVYYNPEKHGLTPVAEIDKAGSYAFDIFCVWKDKDNNLYWAEDSGCSCPSPFENYRDVASLNHGCADRALDAFKAFIGNGSRRVSLDEIDQFRAKVKAVECCA